VVHLLGPPGATPLAETLQQLALSFFCSWDWVGGVLLSVRTTSELPGQDDVLPKMTVSPTCALLPHSFCFQLSESSVSVQVLSSSAGKGSSPSNLVGFCDRKNLDSAISQPQAVGSL
jgi:hypothetical protein